MDPISFSIGGVIALIVFILTAVSIMQSKQSGLGKLLWLLIAFFLSIIGSILWLLLGRTKK